MCLLDDIHQVLHSLKVGKRSVERSHAAEVVLPTHPGYPHSFDLKEDKVISSEAD
jgi:hypothetical protein